MDQDYPSETSHRPQKTRYARAIPRWLSLRLARIGEDVEDTQSVHTVRVGALSHVALHGDQVVGGQGKGDLRRVAVEGRRVHLRAVAAFLMTGKLAPGGGLPAPIRPTFTR